jgi:hypothetical protein
MLFYVSLYVLSPQNGYETTTKPIDRHRRRRVARRVRATALKRPTHLMFKVSECSAFTALPVFSGTKIFFCMKFHVAFVTYFCVLKN